MGLYNKLADEIDEVDVIIAGGRLILGLRKLLFFETERGSTL